MTYVPSLQKKSLWEIKMSYEKRLIIVGDFYFLDIMKV